VLNFELEVKMLRMIRVVFVLLVLAVIGGCTFHFKASELEVDTETKEEQVNTKYELEKVVLLDGRLGKNPRR